MTKEDGWKPQAVNGERNALPIRTKHLPHRVRLPGFITEEEIGLGDVVKRTTSYFGIKPCGGCERRAARLTAGWFSPIDGRGRNATFES